MLEQRDQMLKYRLDKTYLMSALKRGMPANEVLPVLKNLSTYPFARKSCSDCSAMG